MAKRIADEKSEASKPAAAATRTAPAKATKSSTSKTTTSKSSTSKSSTSKATALDVENAATKDGAGDARKAKPATDAATLTNAEKLALVRKSMKAKQEKSRQHFAQGSAGSDVNWKISSGHQPKMRSSASKKRG